MSWHCPVEHDLRFHPYFHRDDDEDEEILEDWQKESIDEEEWDEFCEDVIQTNFGGRQKDR